MKRLTFGFEALTADAYWIRAIQYFGEHSRRAQAQLADELQPPQALAADPPVSFELLYPLLDIATTLDSRFNIAYRFGAVFLAEAYPRGPGRPDLAIALLQALTQVQEATLTFVPKVLAMLITLALMLPFMLQTLTDFTHRLQDKIVHIE